MGGHLETNLTRRPEKKKTTLSNMWHSCACIVFHYPRPSFLCVCGHQIHFFSFLSSLLTERNHAALKKHSPPTARYCKGDHGYWRAGTRAIDLERGMEIST